ncbi:MAG: NAD(P)H-hydrate dehydratase [Odoribacteraceae bacterium]|jgi:NAD(P)H-hydrate epimerase|nr:NAD(P)H-hydrate dehydratase [Odoribacteraceae bacterium]
MECKKIFRAADVQTLDDYTVLHEPIAPIDLMERAARAFTDRLVALYPRVPRFNIVAGTGNNGGDGYAVGRLLLERGRGARLYAVHVSERFSPCCMINRERFLAAGGDVVEVCREEEFVPVGEGAWVDALFGTGLDRPVYGWVAGVIRRLNEGEGPVIAVDTPSGLMSEENRENDGAIVRATRTLTFQFPKLAFMLASNYRHVGRFEVLDIGLQPAILRDHPSRFYYVTPGAVAATLPPFDKFAHKGTLGHALLIAGSDRVAGAALLAARGVVRAGVGLLTVHVPRSLKEMMHVAVPEALVEVDKGGCFTGVEMSSAYGAIGIGPGLGVSPDSALGLRRLLADRPGRLVMDADALNIVAREPAGVESLPAGAVLTPHVGEFDRLTGKAADDFERLNKLINFASRYRLYVVLKGAHTAVATPGGACYFNMSGNPGMAKGGTGDVLTGVLTALLASGLPVEDAVLAGVYVHGLAGDIAAAEHGERGLTSGDVADALGKAWRQCERERDKR